MLKKMLMIVASVSSLLSLSASNAYPDEIRLHVPIIDDSPLQHLFFYELLETAIEDAGHTLILVPEEMNQLRAKFSLGSGKISIFWLIESVERNEKYTKIEVPLTNGLIGNRVLLIKKGDQHLYNDVKNIEDFRSLNLVGGMGRKWFDAEVWKENNLRYKEKSGDWKSIFKMIAGGRDFNYFSRGVNEIIVESEQHQYLDIEKRLIFVYDSDYHFYLSNLGVNAGLEHKHVIDGALKKARDDGLIDRLVTKYWGGNLKALDYDNRIRIYLK